MSVAGRIIDSVESTRGSDLVTAIHEAGHTVAHIRSDIEHHWVTIIPDATEGTAGSVTAEGPNSVYDAVAARKQVLAFCAGYAAVVAAGYSDTIARQGTDNDMEHARALIGFWSLPLPIETYQAGAVELMRQPDNVRAVDFIAQALIAHRRLPGEYADQLVELADGHCSVDEWTAFVTWQYPDLAGWTPSRTESHHAT